MSTVCILSRGERGEGGSLISAHPDVNAAKRAARTYAYVQRKDDRFPLLDWHRDGNTWTVMSANGVDYLEIKKLAVSERPPERSPIA
jgi:hypothetical protein